MSKVTCDLYCRVSTTEQAEEGFSLDEQERKLRAYADAQGWTVHACYRDPGFSGAKLERPGIQAVIDDAIAHRITKVVTYKLDRLSRSQKDTLYLIEDVFIKNHVDYVSMTESLDTGTPFGLAMIGILAVFAQLERETIKERMVIGRIASIKDGKWRGGNGVPIGYRYIPKSADREGQLIVDPYEAQLVRQVYDSFMAGKNYDTITREANAYPLPGRKDTRGSCFARECLQNRFYIGQVRIKGEWYPGRHEPIIPEELFWAVQTRMAEYSADVESKLYRPRTYGALLNGFAFCSECGARMRHVRQHYTLADGSMKERVTYVCSNRNGNRQRKGSNLPKCYNARWDADELESLVWEEVAGLRLEDLQATASNDRLAANIAALEEKQRDLDKQQERLIDLYTVGNMPIDAVRKRAEAVSQEQAKLRTQLEQLRNAAPAYDPEVIRSALERLEQARTGSLEDQRAVLMALVKRIDVSSDELNFTWNF